MSESISDELEAIDLGLMEIVVKKVAMMEAVLKSIKGRMRRRSRMW
jgi:hypothetical protein